VKSKSTTIWDYTTASGLFIVAYHVALVIGLPLYLYHRAPGAGLVAASIALLFLTEIGIGAAYHRFYAHRAYSLSKPAEAVLLFLATLACQGSALRWSFEHRLHHTHVDTDDDPYAITKGFWYAHMLWLFDPPRPIEARRVRDLLDNRLVMAQHDHYGLFSMGGNVLVWLLVGWLCSDYLGAFVLAWWTRLFVSHHLTWFVNSLAHCWGARTYSRDHSARDNHILAFLTVGEGYHNYHHTFASDYRNGVRWYHFDPVKWLVWTLSRVGLAANLRRHSPYAIRRRLLLEDRKFLLQRLTDLAPDAAARLERRVHELSEMIHKRIDRMRELADDLQRLKAANARSTLAKVRRELRELHHTLRRDWQSWTQLSDLILQT
jgi:stearoyl-CoA desaturase (delta-9 desaturase)